MRFFCSADNRSGDEIALFAPDAVHISRVLRMKKGESVVVCDDAGFEHDCVLESVGKDRVLAHIVRSRPHSTEPSVEVTVFAALSKGERFDFLIQKCVEVGATAIVPFVSEHCVARPDERDYERKRARYARIALEASKQSLRSRPVPVSAIQGFEQALRQAAAHETAIFLYERENRRSFSQILRGSGSCARYAVMTGPEGGFSEREARLAACSGLEPASLGPRILRCETAPVAAVCAIMYHTGNYDIGV